MWFNKNSQRWYFAWQNLQWGFSFISSFISRLPCHATGIPPWLLRPVKASTSSELHSGYFWLLLLFCLTQTLWFWVGIFYPQVFFYLTLLPQIFNSTCVCQGLPESRQFYLAVCRVSYWSSKHRSGPSVCLIHSNPLNLYLEEFVFKFYQILYELLVVKV